MTFVGNVDNGPRIITFGDVLDSRGSFTFDLLKINAKGPTAGEQNNKWCLTDLQILIWSH